MRALARHALALGGVAFLVLGNGCKSDLTAALPAERPVSDLARIRAVFPMLEGGVAQFEATRGGRVRSSLPGRTARVELPATAAGPIELRDEASGTRIRFSLHDASAAALVLEENYGTYAGALGGADLLHRVDAHGLEDYVAFPARPAQERIRYDVDVSVVAGLRLVGDVVEFLDEHGVPRLRASSPYVIDANGERSNGHLSIEGCAYDAQPSAPWHRPPTPPGAKTCVVELRWQAPSYPALVDPHWTTTGAMTTARIDHVAALLTTGDVLVAAGRGGPPNSDPFAYLSVTAVDLFHPATNTFVATGSLATGASSSAQVRLPSGKVLLIGGRDAAPGSISLTRTELYDPALGTFSSGGAMGQARAGHTATVLPSGKVLVTGGTPAAIDVSSEIYATSELYDPTTKSFSPTGSMAKARRGHTATLLTSGKVVIVGGVAGNTGSTAAEVYDPATGTFSAVGSTGVARTSAGAALLGSGKVLVAGGDGGAGGTAELFDPATATFTATGNLGTARYGLTATALPSGNALLAGGSPGAPAVVAAAEIYNASTGKVSALADMAVMRLGHTATLLSSGNVLITGGRTSLQIPVFETSAEVLTIFANGKPCTTATGSDCESGRCVDGVCCDSTCVGQCEACDVPGSIGKCTAAIGSPRGARTACPTAAGTDATCAGTCDGTNRTDCSFPAGAVPCDALCEGATLTDSTCDGSGHCTRRAPNACRGHLVCADAKACKPTCSTSTDCTSGFVCDTTGTCIASATCVDEQTSQSTTSETQTCLPYKCDAAKGTCRSTCDSVDQCVAPNACDPDGRCVPIAPEDGGGCSVATGTNAPSGRVMFLVAGVLAAAALRRRRRPAPTVSATSQASQRPVSDRGTPRISARGLSDTEE